MSYTITKTDGSLLTEIIDSSLDTTATDLTLVGKNVSGYGEYLNENFVKLLENFASTSEPDNPIVGQLWFDISENRIKVYDGDGFRVASGPIVSSNPPLTPIQGDFWIDNKENQLYFYDGVDRILAGPIYKDSQGLSGFEINTISDIFGNPKTVTYLWSAANLLGIWSHYPEFTPAAAIPNYSGSIKPGFNPTNITGFIVDSNSKSATELLDNAGNPINASDLFVKNLINITNQPVIINNINALTLGALNETTISVTQNLASIKSNWIDQNFAITVRNSNGIEEAISIKSAASSRYVGIFNNNPQSTLDVGGDVTISGNLTVNGSTTTISTNDLSIEDKLIELSKTATPADSLADGGGIVLKGTTDHSITWSNATQSWNITENFNIPTGRTYKINNVDILSSTVLGPSVTTASGLTQLGNLVQLQVDNININSNTISSTNLNGDIIINPNGIGNVSVSNSRITDLDNPVNLKDAVNLQYLEDILEKPWVQIDSNYTALNLDRLQVSTVSGEVTVGLPNGAQLGHKVTFLDFDGTFDINSLKISRYRKHFINVAGQGVANFVGLINDVPTILDTAIPGSTGSGLRVDVLITNTGTYTSSNVLITAVLQGHNYKNGDIIRILGSDLGGVDGVNDLLFTLDQMDNIFGEDQDIVVENKDSAFSLVYSSPAQGWKYEDTLQLPSVISVDVVGNLTGNVVGNVNGTLIGTVTGDVTGNVTGDVTGNILTSNQPNITNLGTLLSLNVSGLIVGNLNGNTSGIHTGNVITDNITSNNSLLVESISDSIKIKSGSNGILFSSDDDTGAQEQYNIQIVPSTNPTIPSTTLLYGNVVISNTTTSNINGSTFKLPYYTTTQRDDKTYTVLNYGELIYNTTVNKVQVYTNTGWIDLH